LTSSYQYLVLSFHFDYYFHIYLVLTANNILIDRGKCSLSILNIIKVGIFIYMLRLTLSKGDFLPFEKETLSLSKRRVCSWFVFGIDCSFWILNLIYFLFALACFHHLHLYRLDHHSFIYHLSYPHHHLYYFRLDYLHLITLFSFLIYQNCHLHFVYFRSLYIFSNKHVAFSLIGLKVYLISWCNSIHLIAYQCHSVDSLSCRNQTLNWA
jgi:hypothetical protein